MRRAPALAGLAGKTRRPSHGSIIRSLDEELITAAAAAMTSASKPSKRFDELLKLFGELRKTEMVHLETGRHVKGPLAGTPAAVEFTTGKLFPGTWYTQKTRRSYRS